MVGDTCCQGNCKLNENGLDISTIKIGLDFFGVQSVDIVVRCTTSYLLAGPACL